MSANTSRHRVRRSGASFPLVLDVASQSGGPRHAIQATTNYARYIGRVGALAVSLGVGIAVATTPGMAHASTDSDTDAGPAAASGSGSGSGEHTSPQPAAEPSPATSTTTTSTGTSTAPAPGTKPARGRGAPKTHVSSSGGAHTSTHGTDGTAAADAAPPSDDHSTTPDTAPVEESDPTADPAPTPVSEVPAETQTPAAPAPADPSPPGHTGEHTGGSTRPTVKANKGTPTKTTAAVTGSTPDDAQASSAVQRAVPTAAANAVSANAVSANALSAPVAPTLPPANPVAALLATPGSIAGAFSSFVGALLAPFLAPSPTAPAQMPVLWTVLAWVRREIVHTFFNRSPIAAPIQTGQTLAGVVTGKLNASDPNGDPLTATITHQGAFGTVGLAADGTYTYTPTVAVPTTGLTDSFQVAINDSGGAHLRGVFGVIQQFFHSVAIAVGLAQPDTVIKTVNVTVAGSVAAGGIPSVVLTSGVLVYPPAGGPKALDPLVTVVDVDSAQLSGAKVKINVGYNALTDSLGYSSAGGPITGSFDAATGVLTLSGTATVAQYQAALRSVTFASTAADLVGARTASIVVTADNVDSLPGLVAVVMAGLPGNLPSVVLASPAKLYTGNGTPVVLDSSVMVVDVDSTQATGTTVKIGVGYTPGVDTLGYTGPLSSSFDSATGTLTLSGTASVADYQAALRSVTFASTATIGVKTVSIAVITDGTRELGTPGAVLVTVAALPTSAGLPSVVLASPAKLYTGNGTPVVLDSSVTVVDVDSTQATGATVKIGVGLHPGRGHVGVHRSVVVIIRFCDRHFDVVGDRIGSGLSGGVAVGDVRLHRGGRGEDGVDGRRHRRHPGDAQAPCW